MTKYKGEKKGEGLAKHEAVLDALAEVDRLTQQAEEMVESKGESGEDSQALVPVTDRTLAAPALKAKLAKQRSLMIKQQQAMKKASEELSNLMEGKIQGLKAAMRPLEKLVAQAEEMIMTANLYLGRDEEIVMLRDGKAARKESVLYVRQQVLAMDEETMISAEEGGIDARNIEEFDKWLLADNKHLQQVLPEEKGVVVLMPRRQKKEYGDPWMQSAMDKANSQSYWLIRNGEKLWRMATEFNVGNTLVPTKEEFTSFFLERKMNWETKEYETVELQPGSYAWIQAEEKAGKRQRHFMRVALVLQGLVDRTPVFHPLPEGGLNLCTYEAYEAGRVKVITDAEMLLTEGKEPFKAWLKRLNRELSVGMRITGNFRSEAFRHANEHERSVNHSRLYPGNAAYPESDKLYQVKEKITGGGMRFGYERTDEIWDQKTWRVRKPKTQASCLIFPDDTFILPFDLVSVQEMQYYLESRTERHNYVDMVPLLKSAISAKQREEEMEEPFRRLIIGQLMTSDKMDYEEATRLTPGLVDWWKLANRWHRPLVKEPETEAKALKMIVAEGGRRKEAEKLGKGADNVASERLREIEGLLAVFQKPDGSYLGVAAQGKPYVKTYRLASSGKGEVKVMSEWVLPSAGTKRWRQVWASEAWRAWPKNASVQDHLSGPEREKALQEILSQVEGIENEQELGEVRDGTDGNQEVRRRAMAVSYKAKNREFEVWLMPEEKPIDEQRLLTMRVDGIDLGYLDADWRRGKGGKVVVSLARNWVRNYSWSEDMWKREGRETLWEDGNRIGQAKRWKSKVDRVLAKQNVMFEAMRRLEVEIEQAWVKAEEAKAYARFMEDYQDADLWEGHKKTLKLGRMPNDDSLRRLCEIVVERGIEVGGLSVKEALKRARQATFKKNDVAVPSEEELESVLHFAWAH